MNAITTTTAGPSSASVMVPRTMAEAMQLADRMARTPFLAKELQSPGGAMFVMEQAMRWNMSPFAVAMETSFIQGKPMFSGKIVAAACTSMGAVTGRLNYEYSGAGDERTVKVTGTLRGEHKAREVTVRVKDVRTQNKVWNTQPDQQLAYSGSRVWARRHAPEVMLGVYSPEEFDAEPQGAEPREVQSTIIPPEPAREMYSQAGPTLDDTLQGDAIPDFDAAPQPKPDRLRKVADRIKEKLATAESQDAYNEVLSHAGISAEWAKIRDTRPELAVELDGARMAALDRITESTMGDAAEPDQAAA